MNTKHLIAIAAGLSLSLLQGCSRPGFVDRSTVLARVNGQPITEEAYEHYIQARNRYEPLPASRAKAREVVLNEMINTLLLVQEAEKLGLQKAPSVHFRIAEQRDNILVNADLDRYFKRHPLTTAELRVAYMDQYRDGGQVEYRARHILVHSAREARDLIAELHRGARFSVLARAKSLDVSSAQDGGELGWFSRRQMLPAFVSAVAGLKKGEITPVPVRTEFGWHVIQLEDERMTKAPSFSEARERLYRELKRKRVGQLVARLRAQARITPP